MNATTATIKKEKLVKENPANIEQQLMSFYTNKKIPNILFHGPIGVEKNTIVNNFIKQIYNNNMEAIRTLCLFVNCCHGKGIKFVREELIFFAKSHILKSEGFAFKSIVLFNVDKLTIDAQSALRRCIELHSHNTRFFLVAEDKYQLMKPILSRFCEMYVAKEKKEIKEEKKEIKEEQKEEIKQTNKQKKPERQVWLHKQMQLLQKNKCTTLPLLCDVITNLYENAYSGLDIIGVLENHRMMQHISLEKRYQLLFLFEKLKYQILNEKLLMLFMFSHIFNI